MHVFYFRICVRQLFPAFILFGRRRPNCVAKKKFSLLVGPSVWCAWLLTLFKPRPRTDHFKSTHPMTNLTLLSFVCLTVTMTAAALGADALEASRYLYYARLLPGVSAGLCVRRLFQRRVRSWTCICAEVWAVGVEIHRAHKTITTIAKTITTARQTIMDIITWLA